MSSRSIPDIQIVPVHARPSVVSPVPVGRATSQPRSTVEDLRLKRSKSF